jgi:hypothetical protein
VVQYISEIVNLTMIECRPTTCVALHYLEDSAVTSRRHNALGGLEANLQRDPLPLIVRFEVRIAWDLAPHLTHCSRDLGTELHKTQQKSRVVRVPGLGYPVFIPYPKFA